MLLSQFKTGSSASSFSRGVSSGSREFFVLGKARNMKKALEVKATASEGWLESASHKLEAVGGFIEKTFHRGSSTKAPLGDDVVEYKGTAMIMKKLLKLDLIDRRADLVDDASEIFLGRRVTVQLVSTQIDASMCTFGT